MNILVAPDKFKGTFTASEIAEFICSELKIHFPFAHITALPIADGGEGSIDILVRNKKVEVVPVFVKNPRGQIIKAEYYYEPEPKIVYIESAKASGLCLLSSEQRNPMETSSFGTGELILHALNKNPKKVILCLGGSAVNDAGLGMAAALGFQFFTKNDRIEFPVGKHLIHIDRIVIPKVCKIHRNVQFTVLADVRNPLCGETGTAHVFAAQKGASLQEIEVLNSGLQNIAQLIKNSDPNFDANAPFLGAAGGMGAGCAFFLKAKITSGAEYIAQNIDLENRIGLADIVITGEGKFDNQTYGGKAVSIVLDYSRKYRKQTFVICGIKENITHFDTENIHILPLFENSFSHEFIMNETPLRIKKIVSEIVSQFSK
jgi:glycerate kinase